MLKVKGESMIGAGILPGDQVIVEQRPTALNGEIVVAMIDDSATIKRFTKKKATTACSPRTKPWTPSSRTMWRFWAK